MNQITKIFDGSNLRIVEKNNEPWFALTDVCKILEINNVANVRSRLEDGVVTMDTIPDSMGRMQTTSLVNEDGLYDVILDSRKPEAKKFRKWITSEVVPSIRKHGAYMTPETIEQALTDPDTIIQIATQLKQERLKRQQAELTVQQQKPKVLFADAVETSESSILVGQLAKLLMQNGIHIGQNRMFKWLRDNGYLGKQGSHYNEPTQYAMERGWFEVKERTINNPDGTVRITRTTKVTGKGQVYFINKFLSDAALLAR